MSHFSSDGRGKIERYLLFGGPWIYILMVLPIVLPQLCHVVQLQLPLIGGRNRALHARMSLFSIAACRSFSITTF